MAVQGFSSFSSDSSTYIAAKTLMRIKRDVVVYGLGKKEKLPSNNSKTFQFTRYEKLALPQDPITDGVTPNNASMSINVVTAVMDQWGSYVNLSDVAQISIKHPVVQEAIGVLAEQAAETIDREAIKILLANTSVYFPGAVANRGALSATDYIDSAVIRKVTAALRRGGARGYEGRMFVGLVDPSVEQDLNTDTTFVNAASYSNIVVLQNGEVGKWMGVRWVASNLIPTLARITGASGAGSATAGSLAASTTYYFKVSAVEDATGFETGVSVEFTGATGVGQSSVDITIPNVSGYTYKVYAGSSTGVLYLKASGIAGGSTYNVGSIPTSGDVPPATPASGVTVHFSWVLGMESFACPELQSLQTYITNGQATDSDPLAQRRKAGWKVMFKCVICNQAFLSRIESASRY
jgi:N4-gp56 family major capsid protein